MSSVHEAGPAGGAPTGTDSAAAGSAPETATAGTGGGAPHRRLVAVMLLVVALGALGLVALGAAADRGSEPVYLGSTEGSYQWAPEREDYQEPDWSTYDVTTQPPDPDGANTGVIIALVVLGTVLLIAALWVAYRMRKLARPAPVLADVADEDELTATQARTALQDARGRLSTVVDAHDAVIAAWLALERTIAEAGVRRDPSQTTLEFVVSVLGALDLDRSALDHLAHLYRRALFDPRPLVETDRDQALALLTTLSEELGRGPEDSDADDDGTHGEGAR